MKKERFRVNINPKCEVARNINYIEGKIVDLILELNITKEEIRTLQRSLERMANQLPTEGSNTVLRTKSKSSLK